VEECVRVSVWKSVSSERVEECVEWACGRVCRVSVWKSVSSERVEECVE